MFRLNVFVSIEPHIEVIFIKFVDLENILKVLFVILHK